MSSGKEIRTQIVSIKNTQKITSAMEMVAASKMKKAQDRMNASRPYYEKITSIVNHYAHANSEFKHSYMQQNKQIKSIGMIIISSDRGLCGGLNNNLFRELLKNFKDLQSNNINIELCIIGKKAANFFKNSGIKIVATTYDLGDAPNCNDLIGSIKIMLDKYTNGEIGKLSIAFNHFKNTMTQKPTISQIIPINKPKIDALDHYWDYLYEPDAETALNKLLNSYIESIVYQSVVENIACEQSARMVAMKSATDNAGDMVDELALVYNKARQAAITQEISEIVSGAAAV